MFARLHFLLVSFIPDRQWRFEIETVQTAIQLYLQSCSICQTLTAGAVATVGYLDMSQDIFVSQEGQIGDEWSAGLGRLQSLH